MQSAVSVQVSLLPEDSPEIELGIFTDEETDNLRFQLFGGLRDAPVRLSCDALHRIQSCLRNANKRPGIDLTHPSYRYLHDKLAELQVLPSA